MDNSRIKDSRERYRRWYRLFLGLGLFTSLAAAAIIIVLVGIAATTRESPSGIAVFGTTFSKSYAESLGLDWKTVYLAVLDDLNIRQLRLPAPWDQIEPQKGQYDFTDLDWQVAEAAKRHAQVIIAVGTKTPRWPECHPPAWTNGLSQDQVHREALAMIAAVIRRYQNDSTVVNWQVENEPLLNFGVCPKPDPEFLKTEVAEAHDLDRRAVLIQDAGEFSTWQPTAQYADILGVSLYRLVWDRRFGYVHWPSLSAAYRLRTELALGHVSRVIVTELQAEPWTTEDIKNMPLDQQLAQINPQTLQDNVRYAQNIGFPEVYFWGVEWWYWMREQGHPEVWDAGRTIINGQKSIVAVE